jgi:hypothetical protein
MLILKNKLYSTFVSEYYRSLHVLSVNLTKPFDTPVHPRLAQSKAEMVEELLNNYGLSAEKNT